MKKKIFILAAVAVSGLAAIVASNTNKVLGGNDADAHFFEFTACGVRYGCADPQPWKACDCLITCPNCYGYTYGAPSHAIIFMN